MRDELSEVGEEITLNSDDCAASLTTALRRHNPKPGRRASHNVEMTFEEKDLNITRVPTALRVKENPRDEQRYEDHYSEVCNVFRCRNI